MEFYRDLAKVEHALNYVYPDDTLSNEAKPRPHLSVLSISPD